MTLIARGDVPLSIVMTVCTTLGAVILTPLLTKVLAGTYVPVDAVKLSISTLQVTWCYVFFFPHCISIIDKVIDSFFFAFLCCFLGGCCSYPPRFYNAEYFSTSCQTYDTICAIACCPSLVTACLQVQLFIRYSFQVSFLLECHVWESNSCFSFVFSVYFQRMLFD